MQTSQCSTSGAPLVYRAPRAARGCRVHKHVACKAVQAPSDVSKEQVIRFDNAEFVIDETPELKTNSTHRAVVYSSTAVITALTLHGWSNCENLPAAVLAIFCGYIFADIGSGIYHWSVDNYGSGKTPLVGSQIAAFQGHHQRPWTITQREFCNNVSLTFRPGGVAAAVLLSFAALGWTSSSFEIWASTSIFFICMSQQFHAWSHMKKSELHPAVVALQDANLIVSRKVHGAHHRAPFSCNYCIVNGWCNPLLDNGVMHAAEVFIENTTGIAPRCWSDPTADWREQIPPDTL